MHQYTGFVAVQDIKSSFVHRVRGKTVILQHFCLQGATSLLRYVAGAQLGGIVLGAVRPFQLQLLEPSYFPERSRLYLVVAGLSWGLWVPKSIPSWCVLCEPVLLCSYWGGVVQGRLCSGGLLLPLGLPPAFPSWGRASQSSFSDELPCRRCLLGTHLLCSAL